MFVSISWHRQNVVKYENCMVYVVHSTKLPTTSILNRFVSPTGKGKQNNRPSRAFAQNDDPGDFESNETRGETRSRKDWVWKDIEIAGGLLQ